MTIRAVLFDMGGTIETFWQTPQLCQAAVPDLRALMKVGGVDLPVTDIELFRIISAGWNKYRQWSLNSLRELPVESIWCDYIS